MDNLVVYTNTMRTIVIPYDDMTQDRESKRSDLKGNIIDNSVGELLSDCMDVVHIVCYLFITYVYRVWGHFIIRTMTNMTKAF